jgi:S-adenosylmethionine:diacylglycerol 3-amino-3-carboxypropyl transferase
VAALRSVYAPRFLDFLPSHLGRILRGRMERCFARHPNAGNSYARALLLGDAPDDAGTAAANVLLRQADAASFLESEPAGSFDGFTLSNILDGADAHYRQRLFAAVRRAATPGAAVVLRSFAEPEAPLATNHAAGDRSMLWGIVDVRPAAAL